MLPVFLKTQSRLREKLLSKVLMKSWWITLLSDQANLFCGVLLKDQKAFGWKHKNSRITSKSDSHLPKKLSYLRHWKPFKNDEECFLFHLKSLSFYHEFLGNCNTHILDISGSKSNQAIKLGQLIDSNKVNIFLKKLCRKWGRKTSSRSLYFLNMLNMR